MTALLDITNRRFGRLVAVKRFGTSTPVRWLCRCDCGAEHITKSICLTSGGCQSCGCLRNDLRSKHNASRRGAAWPEYEVWKSMKRRCHSPSCSDYAMYGGRGIVVSEAWRDSFETFIADMGRRPPGRYSIDRIDNNGPYAAGNCRWVTDTEQSNNRRRRNRYPHRDALTGRYYSH